MVCQIFGMWRFGHTKGAAPWRFFAEFTSYAIDDDLARLDRCHSPTYSCVRFNPVPTVAGPWSLSLRATASGRQELFGATKNTLVAMAESYRGG